MPSPVAQQPESQGRARAAALAAWPGCLESGFPIQNRQSGARVQIEHRHWQATGPRGPCGSSSQPQPEGHVPAPLPIAAAEFNPPEPESRRLFTQSPNLKCTGAQTRKSPIPVPPIPDFAGKRGGNPRFPARPESGKRESPIPDSAGNGNRGPDWPQIGKSGIPLCVSTSCTILGWMLP